MAKKKINVRKDYSYATKKSLPAYKPARIPRKLNYLVLRGPGHDPREVTNENVVLRAFADKKQIKLKFLQGNTEDEIVKILKDANPWAAGVVLNLGSLDEESAKIRKAVSQILYSTEEVGEDASYENALLKLLSAK